MSDEAKTIPTWGYHKTKEAKIFDLKEGESLPRGWADAPVSAEKTEEDEEPKTGDKMPIVDVLKPDAV